MKKIKWIIILVNLLLLIGYINFSLVQKEKIIANGTLILFELAPVDPRSLIQGDFMRLNYAISALAPSDSLHKRGYCVVKLSPEGVAVKERLQEHSSPLYEHEYLIPYTSSGTNDINIGAESYFFQEGNAERFEKAKYGGIKVDAAGNSLLVGLYDEKRIKIED